MKTLIAAHRGLGYSDIYLDFLGGNGRAGRFYVSKDIGAVTSALDQLSFQRDELVAILRRQNNTFGASTATHQSIDKLLDPRAVCVFTGQQAILFGGPLLVIIKALSIIRAADKYSKELGRPVVPIFWIAGDDHDFEEVNHTTVLDRDGGLRDITYATSPERELPTSEILFSDHKALTDAIVQLKDTLGGTDFTGELYEIIDKSYTSDDTFVSAFGKLMLSLLGRFGLVLFNPGDRQAKVLAAPFFRRIVESQDAIYETLARTNNLLRESGYHVQVEKADSASHLFYNEGGRRPIHRDGNNFECNAQTITRVELLALIDTYPERFSADVITRPVLQSYLFPTLSQKGGPSEIAYFAQINPIFSLFEVIPPCHQARPSATFVEPRLHKVMDEYKISFEEITGDIEQVINRVMAESFPEDIERNFAQLRHDVESRIEEFSQKSLGFDRSLADFAKQTFGKVDYALRTFEGKVFSSHKKKSGVTRERIYRLGNALYPDRTLQERRLNAANFLSKYGMDFLSFAHDHIDSEETAHQLIFLSEMTA